MDTRSNASYIGIGGDALQVVCGTIKKITAAQRLEYHQQLHRHFPSVNPTYEMPPHSICMSDALHAGAAHAGWLAIPTVSLNTYYGRLAVCVVFWTFVVPPTTENSTMETTGNAFVTGGGKRAMNPDTPKLQSQASANSWCSEWYWQGLLHSLC